MASDVTQILCFSFAFCPSRQLAYYIQLLWLLYV